jgi:hypothetical protein
MIALASFAMQLRSAFAAQVRSVPERVTVSVAVPPSVTVTASDASAKPTIESCCWHCRSVDIEPPEQLG